jgi:hypothetical protein
VRARGPRTVTPTSGGSIFVAVQEFGSAGFPVNAYPATRSTATHSWVVGQEMLETNPVADVPRSPVPVTGGSCVTIHVGDGLDGSVVASISSPLALTQRLSVGHVRTPQLSGIRDLVHVAPGVPGLVELHRLVPSVAAHSRSEAHDTALMGSKLHPYLPHSVGGSPSCVELHAPEAVGVVDVKSSPSKELAMHRFSDGHEIPVSIPVGKATACHAAAPPVGSVEVSTKEPETPAHRLGDAHDRDEIE